MSYQALARKWRPKQFGDVVGQEHVVQALSNALDRDQVHHAFLFTGTRGVGKTTLARIFAKALNCEKGLSSTPCNECSSCNAIDDARFVDLIEVDAASRTKVDDTRELLDNVQYAPTSGRYKVYLIDEVHMLSGHSFNALLKTLEEPPPHVKFLLATTEPQKLPVTVLSRCLQFNLKALQLDQIQNRLHQILEAEGIEPEENALGILARAANGSLRDGLSLLDQALAYSGGQLEESMVRKMLGTIEDDIVEKIIRALADNDADTLMQVTVDMAERSLDYAQALDEILVQIHNLSLYQISREMLTAKQAELAWHAELASQIDATDLQLYYQIGLIGKRDLPMAPDPRTGFEMVLLRMLAFKPAADDAEPKPVKTRTAGDQTNAVISPPAQRVEPRSTKKAVAEQPVGNTVRDLKDWGQLVAHMSVNGLVKELAMNLGLSRQNENTFFFELDPSHEHLLDPSRVELITHELRRLGIPVSINVQVTKSDIETPALRIQRLNDEKHRAAEQALAEDPNVQALQEKFGATIVKESIRVRD
ncbi:MAG: DNA polymerase III subunit gamma/tau [Arenicellales bacterium]|nr:DNA polymerase III subunit gamma/tau [Arenicellales bacterium]